MLTHIQGLQDINNNVTQILKWPQRPEWPELTELPNRKNVKTTVLESIYLLDKRDYSSNAQNGQN
jgi:hypothetical protein